MDPIVKTSQGELRGRLENGVAVFRGVPYAAAPFGERRLRPPSSPNGWDGVRDAGEFGATAPQPSFFAPFDRLLGERIIEGDDCLNLNIWTADPGRGGMAVLVWIHGGGFSWGMAAMPAYDGSRFARDGVVCVTINYRLGIDGFLFNGDGIANVGLLDQVAALEWVRDNIASFGGDPARVTVMGQSAGAMSIAALLAMPRAAGLFRAAILQSGAGHHVLAPATATMIAEALAHRLGVPPVRDAIATVPMERLFAVQADLFVEVFNGRDPRWGEAARDTVVFEPVIDGTVLPMRPVDAVGAGSAAGVDVLVGTNTEEWRLYTLAPAVHDSIDDVAVEATLAGYGLEATAAEAYRAGLPGASAGDVLCAVVTDWFFRIPAIRLAEAHVESGGRTWMYEFAWRSPAFGGRLGACHCCELSFVFDTLNLESFVVGIHGDAPPQSVADETHSAWVRFVTEGDPGWPRYDLKHRSTMHFDIDSSIAEDPRSAERTLWAGVR